MDNAILMAKHRAYFPDNKFRSIGEKYYEWKITNNPYMQGYIYLEKRDGKVVGSSTATPKKVAVLNEQYLAAELGDSFTLPAYRKQGINTKALKNCIDTAILQGVALVYGAPAAPANHRLLLKLGMSSSIYVKYNILNKRLKPLGFALKLVSKMLLRRNTGTEFWQLKYQLKKKYEFLRKYSRQNTNEKNDFNIEVVDQLKYEIDGLWGKPRYMFCLVRDSCYLNWRFFKNPDKYIFLVAIKNDEYLGYVVLKIAKDNKTGLICDFITIDDRSDVFLALVKKSEQILKQKGADLVQLECIAGTAYYDTLIELGYYDHARKSEQLMQIYSKTELGKRILENRGMWHFTLADTDEA